MQHRVAPNIYYLGFAGVVRVGGLRIAGWSGIYDKSDYRKGISCLAQCSVVYRRMSVGLMTFPVRSLRGPAV